MLFAAAALAQKFPATKEAMPARNCGCVVLSASEFSLLVDVYTQVFSASMPTEQAEILAYMIVSQYKMAEQDLCRLIHA